MDKRISAAVAAKFQEKDFVRIVLFGASNTERHLPTVHWGDVLEVGLRSRYGRKFHIINAGVSGNNTREALARMERDVLFYQPDIVIVTFGGNDCNIGHVNEVPEGEFAANLTSIVEQLQAAGAVVIVQSYYKMILPDMVPARAEAFVRYMDIVRETAEEKNWLFSDQYRFFEKINLGYRRYNLMRDAMHTNENGNILIGLELLRRMDVDIAAIPWGDKLQAMLRIQRQTLEKE